MTGRKEKSKTAGSVDAIPKDHPIRKVWEANRNLGSVEGMIKLAKDGDTYAARQLLVQFTHQIWLDEEDKKRGVRTDRDIRSGPLARYFSECFIELLRIKKCNGPVAGALNLTSRKKLTSKRHQELARIGWKFAQKLDLYSHGAYDAVKKEVAQEENCSERTAERAYSTYMKLGDTAK